MAKSAKRKAPFAAGVGKGGKHAEPNPFERGHGKQKFKIVGRTNLSATKNINKARSEAVDKVRTDATSALVLLDRADVGPFSIAAQEDFAHRVQAAEKVKCVC